MTWIMIYNAMKQGRVSEVYEEGLLTVYWLQLAVKEGWMSLDEANNWGEAILNL